MESRFPVPTDLFPIISMPKCWKVYKNYDVSLRTAGFMDAPELKERNKKKSRLNQVLVSKSSDECNVVTVFTAT